MAWASTLAVLVVILMVIGCGYKASTPAAPTQAPTLDSLTPNHGDVGTAVTLQGLYFGASQDDSQVTFHGVVANTESWSDTNIVAEVPEGAETGDVLVTTAAGTSNALTFTFDQPASPGP